MERSWLARPAAEVAPDLLGCLLHAPGEGVLARIVEVEAYDEADPAAHSFRGPTPGNAVMFGPPGHLYTYFTYGMHWCANVVTGPDGRGEAVLLRAAELVDGTAVVAGRRGPRVPARDLLRGPARLAQGLGLHGEHRGLDLLGSRAPLRLLARDRPAPPVAVGPRTGVRLAADVPWRFWLADHPLVSPYRRHPKAAPRPRPPGGVSDLPR